MPPRTPPNSAPCQRKAAIWLTAQHVSPPVYRPPPAFQAIPPLPAGQPGVHASRAHKPNCSGATDESGEWRVRSTPASLCKSCARRLKASLVHQRSCVADIGPALCWGDKPPPIRMSGNLLTGCTSRQREERKTFQTINHFATRCFVNKALWWPCWAPRWRFWRTLDIYPHCEFFGSNLGSGHALVIDVNLSMALPPSGPVDVNSSATFCCTGRGAVCAEDAQVTLGQ